MASGFKRKRGGDEYIFVDGKAMRQDEVLRIDVGSTAAPGQAEVQAGKDDAYAQETSRFARSRAAFRAAGDDDAFGLRGEQTAAPGGPQGAGPGSGPGAGEKPEGDERPSIGVGEFDERLMYEDRRQTRRKCLILGGVLLLVICASLCLSKGYYFRFYSPVDVVTCYGQWFRLRFIEITDTVNYAQARYAVLQAHSMYLDVLSQTFQVMKYTFCGAILAVAGMLYQNTFRNPIAAPSMLGVSNGVSIAILVLVLVKGTEALSYMNLYYLWSFLGGAFMLVLVIIAGRWISGNGQFNVVNMLLMGTIMSQLTGVIMTYVQSYVFTDAQWETYYELQTATGTDTYLGFAIVAICTVITIIPVIVFRFQLNLVSFSDAETKLLGIDPERLRVMALVIGSLMVLTAQISAGQVSMVSLIVPFVARAVFGAEFRKQLLGTCLLGSLVLLICGDLTSLIYIDNIPLDLGSIVTIVTLPLFVWMLTLQQRAWE